jgi:hypothetical protein
VGKSNDDENEDEDTIEATEDSTSVSSGDWEYSVTSLDATAVPIHVPHTIACYKLNPICWLRQLKTCIRDTGGG